MRRLMLASLLGLAATARTDRTLPSEWSGPPGSSKPFLTKTPRGELLLSWFEPRPDHRFALRVATTQNGRWSEPVTAVDSDRLFVNWADFPSIVETTRGTWVVHWLEKNAARSYAYDIRLATTKDRGRTWTAPITVNRDGTPTEHGFVSMVPRGDGSVALAWLDGRQMVDSGGAMSVRAAVLRADGRLDGEQVLDSRTCECCQVSLASTAGGLIAAYRDRSADEVRDIAVVREVGGRWTSPRLVANDHWVWKACPVNGPSVSAIGNEVGVAWFTGAGGTPAVKVAFSRDGGATFGAPTRTDNGHTMGRVHFQMTGPGRGALVWLETEADGATWMVRTVGPRGPGSAQAVGRASRARDAGFPRTAVVGNDLWIAYVAIAGGPQTTARVQVTRVALGQ